MIGDHMNKKGFTLVELMATIGLLAIMSLVIGVNITSILKSTKQNEEEFNKEQIEKAACVYYSSEGLNNNPSGSTNITVENLIKSGLLDETYRNENGKITITFNDNEKKCSYNK